MKTYISEENISNLCINEPAERLFIIEDGKSPYDKSAYREVVLQRGEEVVDIVYTKQAYRYRSDFNLIDSQLLTYGFNEAKKLAEYLKTHQDQINKS